MMITKGNFFTEFSIHQYWAKRNYLAIMNTKPQSVTNTENTFWENTRVLKKSQHLKGTYNCNRFNIQYCE